MGSKKKEPTSSKINFLMQFSLLYFQMNDTCEGMNFTHLTELMLLCYPVKVNNTKNVILQWDITTENCIT